MKKVLVGMTALLVATGVSFAAGCTSGGKKCGCKPKKYRIVYVTAHNPDTMYDNSMFETREVGPDYRMVPTEHASAMYDRGVSYEDDDQYYERPETQNDGNMSISPYIGTRLGVNLWSWENKYKVVPATAYHNDKFDHDKYTFEPVFGGAVFAGFNLGPAWRADLEVGYAGRFSDSDSDFQFKMSSRHVTLNGYYNFAGGFYLGAGVGAAFTKGRVSSSYVTNSETKSYTSFLGAGMLGWAHHLTDSVVLDFRYRLSGFNGPKWTAGISGIPAEPGYDAVTGLKIKTGLIWDNAFTVGIRFEF